MSTFDNEDYKWRETYFVLFDSSKRPSLKRTQKMLRSLSDRYVLVNLEADEQGRFNSLTVLAPDNNAALDISYVSGEEVLGQTATMIEDMKLELADQGDQSDQSDQGDQGDQGDQENNPDIEKYVRLAKCDARFEVMHFERVFDAGYSDEEPDDMLDPGALLLILGALVELCDGVGVDPQSGTLV